MRKPPVPSGREARRNRPRGTTPLPRRAAGALGRTEPRAYGAARSRPPGYGGGYRRRLLSGLRRLSCRPSRVHSVRAPVPRFHQHPRGSLRSDDPAYSPRSSGLVGRMITHQARMCTSLSTVLLGTEAARSAAWKPPASKFLVASTFVVPYQLLGWRLGMRLYIMQLGMNPTTGNPYPAYLIQANDGSNVLVDTGFGPQMVEISRRPDHQGARVTSDDLVVNQLARLGLRPENIRYLIATHFDGDHVGSLATFTNAEVVV